MLAHAIKPNLSPAPFHAAVRHRAQGLAASACLIMMCGCATTVLQAPLPTPEEIPRLEAHLARDSTSAPALVRLGIAYREAGRFPEARQVLERAGALQADDAAVIFYLGLTYEDLDLPSRARELYQTYLEVGRSADLKARISARIPLLERQILKLGIREALAREAELGAQAPEPRTVAVFPFLYLGQDQDLHPLSRALAEMLVTDLSQTDRIRVLERVEVQALLDEIALSGTELVDPATALRSGRLLGAGRIVQGQFDGDPARIRLQAAVAGLGGASEGRPISEEDALRRLFEAQKRLALGIYRSLGVELTPAERERVMRRPTESVEALLAYGRGLGAEDGGDFAQAAQHYRQAVSLDPGFAAAQARADRATAMAVAAQTSTAQLARIGAVGTELLTSQQLALQYEAVEAIHVLIPDPLVRNAALEVQGREGIGRAALLRIILPRP